ncbi:putative sugar transferase EpsL [Zhongshania aliphaticivorans]|uniref:Putative sugar transferase EpsL n=1 Tax=Zhongshania aliphaticivorans TaxID=1470434 RepID=A0A5S9NCE1_9GAMM|nr:sugar transferase [Zhongshania aliphaticivorans]CAA0087008.1 putative sugar transferase EpsL [Zhongshania aliphaticivorans]CAA0113893.1 putative sugar transferase EpsL [Zhongshania aliphaticivorans]
MLLIKKHFSIFPQNTVKLLIALASLPTWVFRTGYKRIYDIAGSFLLIIALSPLLLITAIAISWESRGGVFFRQQRVGKNGQLFGMIKFRSMSTDQALHEKVAAMESDRDGVCKKFVNDPRVTKVGNLIRKLSIDELPQLINVLRGEMSLIGPRPALTTEVEQYTDYDRRRLQALPGISGLWQVSGRADLSFAEQIDLDLRYIRERNLLTDITITLKTIPAVLLGAGAY